MYSSRRALGSGVLAVSLAGVIGFLALAMTFRPAGASSSAIPGDADLSGAADLADVEAFALMIRGPEDWRARYGGTVELMLLIGDFNGDGVVNNVDAPAFGQVVGANVVRSRSGVNAEQKAETILDDFPANLVGGGLPGTVPSTIDVDVDSDNNGGVEGVARNTAEENAEDVSAGKIVLVNDDDDDRNLVVDSAQSGRNTSERDDLVRFVVDANRDASYAVLEGLNVRLTFPSATVRVWRYRDRGAAPAEEVLSGGIRTARLLGDTNCDGFVNVGDIGAFVTALTNANDYRTLYPNCSLENADADLDTFVTVGDIGVFVSILSDEPPPAARFAPQWFWVEGLQASSIGGDRTITAEADFDGNGSYDAGDSVKLTGVRISASPNAGMLGTPITFSATPTVAPMTFTSAASLRWIGNFVPQQGAATSAFTVDVAAAQVIEAPNGQSAQIAYGAGSISFPPAAFSSGPGVLQGQASLAFSPTLTATRQFDFTPALAGYIATILRPDAGLTVGSPTLGPRAFSLDVLQVATDPAPTEQTESALLFAFGFHYAAVVEVAENGVTAQTAPISITADVVSYTSAGVEYDRVTGVELRRTAIDDDPTKLFYTSDLLRPIVLVDYQLSHAPYPNVIVLSFPAGGSGAVAVLASVP